MTITQHHRTPAPTPGRGRLLERLPSLADAGIFIATAALIVLALIVMPKFGSASNVRNILLNVSFVGMVALGITFVTAAGKMIDLSVVAQIGTAAVAAMALQPHGVVVATAAGLGACLLFGAVNGFAVGVARANPVVATLATQTVGMGVLTLLTHGTLYQGSSHAFTRLGVGGWGPIPLSIIIFAGALVIAHYTLHYTKIGYGVRAVGASEPFARAAGVANTRIVLYCFAAASVGAWGTGLLLASYSNTAIATVGHGYEFDALAAVIIGGNSLFGGRASVVRTAVGVLLIALITNVLVLAGLPFAVQQLVKGAVIIVAVTVDVLLQRKRVAK